MALTFVRHLYRKYKYFGFKFKCPFCRGHFRKFLPCGFDFPVLEAKKVIGGRVRPQGMCPRCRSIDRERLIFLYLKYKTEAFFKPIRMLHVAPEVRLQKILMAASNIQYLSVDQDPGLGMMKVDITNIPYGNGSFDVILCNHVLEHIVDDYKAMSELYRVLKPGGWAILQVPISAVLPVTYEDPVIKTPLDREKAFGQDAHVRIYARDYKTRLEKSGFSVTTYNFSADYGIKTARTYGLIEEEDLYICSKKK